MVDSILCDRKAHVRVFVPPRRLLMVRNRVVHVRPDLGTLERRSCTLAILENGDRKVCHISLVSTGHESADCGRERLAITLNNAPPPRIPLVETAEAKTEHTGLQLVQPRVLRSGQ
jgi:hypothetical protein